MPTPQLRRLGVLLMLLALPAGLGAQDLFSPAIVVNDRAVTGYELDQRQRLLQFFNTPGDVAAAARTQLVEERLKVQELERVGLALAPEDLAAALDDFAARLELDGEELTTLLGQNGIAPETLRDYVSVNTAWNEYIRQRFGERVEVTEAEIDQRLAEEAGAAAGIEVLLSEIIIPAPPAQAGQAQEIALAISRVGSEAEFEAAAREYSALPSREQGGRLDWTPLTGYPAGLRDIILALAPGEVTAPIPLEGGIALLQLRGVREGDAPAAEPEQVDYAVLRIPGGLSPASLAEAQRVDAAADGCVDLYEVARGLPADRLVRQQAAPGALPADLALELAKLDAGEASYGLTADGGATLLFVMLCGRSYALPEGASDRAAVASAIRVDELENYASAIVADLRASATIVGE